MPSPETPLQIFERTRIRELQLSRLLIFYISGGLSAFLVETCGVQPYLGSQLRLTNPTRGERCEGEPGRICLGGTRRTKSGIDDGLETFAKNAVVMIDPTVQIHVP